MAVSKKPQKLKQLKAELAKELNFMKNIFSVLSIPARGDAEENMDYEIYSGTPNNNNEEKQLPKRAKSIAELEEKLQKIKSQNNFNLKTKLAKKSLTSKLNKKIKKKERVKNRSKPLVGTVEKKPLIEEKPKVNVAKPIFNNDGKLVFSKFDFANVDREKAPKAEKDPKKLLESLQQQEEKIKKLEESEEGHKAKEIKEKLAWKSVLSKAEGQKVKDDPELLKKSIKKMEQMKKHSKKKWDERIQSVEQKKEMRQKKRKENISKKKKEKKTKKIKTSAKRGRVVIQA